MLLGWLGLVPGTAYAALPVGAAMSPVTLTPGMVADSPGRTVAVHVYSQGQQAPLDRGTLTVDLSPLAGHVDVASPDGCRTVARQLTCPLSGGNGYQTDLPLTFRAGPAAAAGDTFTVAFTVSAPGFDPYHGTGRVSVVHGADLMPDRDVPARKVASADDRAPDRRRDRAGVGRYRRVAALDPAPPYGRRRRRFGGLMRWQ